MKKITGNQAEAAAAVMRRHARKVLTMPSSGAQVTIGKLDQLEYIRRGGTSLIVSLQRLEEKGEGEGAVIEDIVAPGNVEAIALMLEMCMLSPKLWRGPEEGCPADAVTMGDIGDDLRFLVEQVIEFTVPKKEAEAAGKFRGHVGRGTGPGRQEVSGAADGPVGTGAVATDPDLRGGAGSPAGGEPAKDAVTR